MKSTPEPTDRAPVLGAPIREAKPTQAPAPVAPGVVRNASGQLETQIAPPAPIWKPAPHAPAQVDWSYGVIGRPVGDIVDEQTED